MAYIYTTVLHTPWQTAQWQGIHLPCLTLVSLIFPPLGGADRKTTNSLTKIMSLNICIHCPKCLLPLSFRHSQFVTSYSYFASSLLHFVLWQASFEIAIRVYPQLGTDICNKHWPFKALCYIYQCTNAHIIGSWVLDTINAMMCQQTYYSAQQHIPSLLPWSE